MADAQTVAAIIVPHDFKEMREAVRLPTLIFGSGLSAGRVPPPNALLEEIKDTAEAALQCGPVIGVPADGTALYKWAEEVLSRLGPNPVQPNFVWHTLWAYFRMPGGW